MRFRDIIWAVALGAALIFGMQECKRADLNAQDAKDLFTHQIRQQKTHIDELGRMQTEVDGVAVHNQKLLQAKVELETEVKGLKGKVEALTKVQREFRIQDTVKTDSIVFVPGRDSIINDTVYIFPNYNTNHKNNWLDMNIYAGPADTYFDLLLRDDFSVTHTRKKKLFGKDLLNVYVKSLNPYVDSQNVEPFIFEQKPKRWNLSAQIGFGVNKNLELSPYVGIGLGYSLVQW